MAGGIAVVAAAKSSDHRTPAVSANGRPSRPAARTSGLMRKPQRPSQVPVPERMTRVPGSQIPAEAGTRLARRGLRPSSSMCATPVAPQPMALSLRPAPEPGQIQRCGGVQCPPGTCDHDQTEKVHRFGDGTRGSAGVPAIVARVLRTPGQALDTPARAEMEGRFGHDFTHVRVHTDAGAAQSARAIHAQAFTFGRHVVMGEGRYQPNTEPGMRLLAHELAHVVQQGNQAADTVPARAISQPGDLWEREADQHAEAVARADSVRHPVVHQPGSAGTVLRQTERREPAPGPDGGISGAPDAGVAGGPAATPDAGVPTGPAGTPDAGLPSSAPPAPAAGPASAPFICGPDVRSQLVDVVAATKALYNGWPSEKQEEACWALENKPCGGAAWDIVEMHNAGWIPSTYQPLGCATTGATPACGQSVKVGAGCHYSGSPNYVIFGVMANLCNMWRATVHALIYVYKHKSPNYDASLAWALAGYDGWPGVADPPGDRNNCSPTCPVAYTGGPFTVHWYPSAQAETVGGECEVALRGHRMMRDTPPSMIGPM